MRFLNILFATLILSIAFVQPSFADSKISTIKITGQERISADTVFAYLELNRGDAFDQAKVDESIKSLYKTGFFSDVKISFTSGTLNVAVKENSMVNKIAFDGNKRIEDKDILEELSMKPHTIFSMSKMQNDLNRMSAIYQSRGRYGATIEPKFIQLDQNRINVVYEISEGNEANIRKILFTGNDNFAESELKEIIASKESRWYRFFSSADIYDINKQKVDNDMVRYFYQTHGFADFKINTSVSELSADKDAFLLTFIINEGEIYTYGDITLENNIKNIQNSHLKNLLTLKSGQLFNIENVDANVDLITKYLGEYGFPFVEVEHHFTTHPETKLVNVKFTIKESYKVYLRKINIKNNTRTLDKVIRREFRIAEGDPYNISKIQRSKQRVDDLGYFSKVDFKNKRTEESDKIDIDVEVEETSTGSINLAGGYDTSRGAIASVTLTEDNFLGKGQQAQIGLTQAQRERGVSLGFTEPYFMNKELSAGVEFFAVKNNMRKTSSYDSRTLGTVFSLGYKITEHLSHGLRYSIKKESITGVPADASMYVKSQQGHKIVSMIGHTLAYNRLDSQIDPTDGYILKFSQDLAGVGGNTKFISNEGTAAYFKPVYKKDWIFKLLGKAGAKFGYSAKKVQLVDRFYIGPDYIRGFDIAGVGPRDKKTGDALGGNKFYAGTAELYFPIGLPKELGVKASIFTDVGSLWDAEGGKNIYDKSTLRAAYGLSIHWKSPVGHIGIHYGIPFKSEKFDAVRKFYLNYSTKF